MSTRKTVVERCFDGFRRSDHDLIAFTDVHEPVYYGPDVAAALDWVRGSTYASVVLKRLDVAAAVRAVGRLRGALSAHLSDDGVWFNSRAWIITARRH